MPSEVPPHELLGRFRDLDVLVVGDTVLDVWRHGTAQRLSREGPAPVVEVDRVETAPGAAGNCAANAAAMGARVRLLSVVGDDLAGQELRKALRRCGVATDGIVEDAGHTTPVKQRLVCDGQVLARFDTPSAGSWTVRALVRMREAFTAAAEKADVVVVVDHGEGSLGDEVREAVSDDRGSLRGPLVVDGHDFERWTGCRVTAMTPSAAEATALMGWSEQSQRRVQELRERSAELLAGSGADMLVTTLDSEGTLLHRPGRPPHRTRTRPAPASCTCGAGDTFTAAFALTLAAGGTPEQATDVAQCAADAVVRRVGTTTCSSDDLIVECRPGPQVLDGQQLALRVAARRAAGDRVVFTNGCFDVLHLGHARYLEQAGELGDVLVVAVNDDDSVRRLKGAGRPVVPAAERASMVAALKAVDYVTVFAEDSPRELIRALRPDVYAKGGDYTPQMLPETPLVEEVGGEVVCVGYLADHSTTELVERIHGRELV